jgi:hypothetical protein
MHRDAHRYFDRWNSKCLTFARKPSLIVGIADLAGGASEHFRARHRYVGRLSRAMCDVVSDGGVPKMMERQPAAHHEICRSSGTPAHRVFAQVGGEIRQTSLGLHNQW